MTRFVWSLTSGVNNGSKLHTGVQTYKLSLFVTAQLLSPMPFQRYSDDVSHGETLAKNAKTCKMTLGRRGCKNPAFFSVIIIDSERKNNVVFLIMLLCRNVFEFCFENFSSICRFLLVVTL